jgi:hypothetical protein
MATRFVFTIRDGMWLCVVLFLAMGWHTQVRYSGLIDNPTLNKPYSPPLSFEQLQEQNNEQSRRLLTLNRENEAMRYAAHQMLTQDQREEFKAKMEEFERDWRREHSMPVP